MYRASFFVHCSEGMVSVIESQNQRSGRERRRTPKNINCQDPEVRVVRRGKRCRTRISAAEDSVAAGENVTRFLVPSLTHSLGDTQKSKLSGPGVRVVRRGERSAPRDARRDIRCPAHDGDPPHVRRCRSRATRHLGTKKHARVVRVR